MNDEEKAEEYIRTDGTNGEKAWKKILKEFPNCIVVKSAKSKEKLIELLLEYTRVVFLDGLAEGKPKWHDLRKDPNDLPKERGDYWTKYDNTSEERGDFYDVHYFEPDKPFYKKHWSEIGVIAWCELPKFEE